ncbi:MAG: DUF3592 domain-containing protein [Anaerolineae bacterium]|nr:DUF3592 domain-containing protein [Anaerolineae bacterium]
MFDNYTSADGLASAHNPSSADVFLVNPRNDAFVTGRADKPARDAGTGCMMLFLLPFVVAGLVITTWTVLQWRDWLVLSLSGANTKGYFTDRSISEGDDSTSYFVNYRYVVDDREYTRKDQVSYATYEQAASDAPIQVLYFTGDPGIATLDLNYARDLRTFLTIFSLFWDGFVGLIFFGGVYSVITNRRLAQNGHVIFGEITHITSRYDSDNDYYIEVKYRFYSPFSGKYIDAKHKFQDNARKNVPLPKHGKAVAILYADDKSYRLL